MGDLQVYRVAYGSPPLPAPGERTPLILGARRRTPAIGVVASARQLRAVREDFGTIDGITNRSSLYRLIEGIFREALAHWSAIDPVEADRPRLTATHWLWHTLAKQMIDGGADLITISRNLSHADVNTTWVYVDDEKIERVHRTQAVLGLIASKG